MNEQTPQHELPDALGEQELAELTTDSGPQTRLWERALNQVDGKRNQTMSGAVIAKLHRPLPRQLLAVAALVILCVLVVGAMLPSLGRARFMSRSSTLRSEQMNTQIASATDAHERGRSNAAGLGGEMFPQVDYSVRSKADLVPSATVGYAGNPPVSVAAPSTPNEKQVVPQRSVIRKATIELVTPDVRAALAKVQLSIRGDLGEYVEGSSLNGEGKDAIGQMTLRIAAARMDSEMNDLRQLGTVRSETASGDDVTDQAVDIDARLRNERRVEAEVLELLSSRKDAPLNEILSLRDKLAQLRQNIEQLQARKDNLDRAVSLATVLVIIRPEDAPPKSELSPIGDYFGKQFGDAWRSGTIFLADTLATLTRIAIGGLPWWIVIAVVALVECRMMHKAAAKAA